MTARGKPTAFLPVIAGIALLSGCRSENTLRRPDFDLNRMVEVPRYDPYEASPFFADGKVLREPPEGTLPYGTDTDPARTRGERDGKPVTEIPLPLTRTFVENGRHHFEQICASCHGILGDGDTVVAERMRRKPPSLHEPRLVDLPVGTVFQVTTEGYGFMPGYEAALADDERWAVVAYVKALQRSQHVRLAELSPDAATEVSRRLR